MQGPLEEWGSRLMLALSTFNDGPRASTSSGI